MLLSIGIHSVSTTEEALCSFYNMGHLLVVFISLFTHAPEDGLAHKYHSRALVSVHHQQRKEEWSKEQSTLQSCGIYWDPIPVCLKNSVKSRIMLSRDSVWVNINTCILTGIWTFSAILLCDIQCALSAVSFMRFVWAAVHFVQLWHSTSISMLLGIMIYCIFKMLNLVTKAYPSYINLLNETSYTATHK